MGGANLRKGPLGVEVRCRQAIDYKTSGRVVFEIHATDKPLDEKMFFSTPQIRDALEKLGLEETPMGVMALNVNRGANSGNLIQWKQYEPFPGEHVEKLESNGIASQAHEKIAEVLASAFPDMRVNFPSMIPSVSGVRVPRLEHHLKMLGIQPGVPLPTREYLARVKAHNITESLKRKGGK